MARHPKQKRERTAPTQTLHDFFTSKPISSQNNKGNKTLPDRGQEIIIINSDSDDERERIVQACTSKRRKLNSGNGTSPTPNLKEEPERPSPLAHHSSKENSATVVHQVNSSEFNQHVFSTTSSTNQEAPRCFGQPILLLDGSPNKPSQEHVPPSFGEPILLTSTNNMTNLLESERVWMMHTSTSVYTPPTEDHAVDIDLTVDNWEDGDDEIPVESKSADDSDIEFESVEDLNTRKLSKMNAMAFNRGNSENLRNNEIALLSNSESLKPSKSIGPPIHQSKSLTLTSSSTCTGRDRQASEHNAFSFLMTSFKETEIWKEATISKDNRATKAEGKRRKAPFYKVLQGMPIAVDAFNFGKIPHITAYFLTHAHSDHYTNLSSAWKNGPIYCSQGTANLIVHKLSVDKAWVHPLPMNTPTIIPDTNGVTVTLIEANHCPGSCLFFFEGSQTVNAGDSPFKSSYIGSSRVFRYLHCGDFRASPNHVLHPAVKGKVIDHVYLDTTYLDPKYMFPPQPLVISACAELAKRVVSGDGNTTQDKSSVLSWVQSSDSKGKEKGKGKGRLLVLIGTYSIGKERIAKAIAQALNTKIYCDARKQTILQCQDDTELHDLLTSDPQEGFVHLVPLGSITSDHLKSYLEGFNGFYGRILGFRPTGWTYTQAAGANQSPSIQSILSQSSNRNYTFADLVMSPKSTTNLSLYPVPYSEHSSFYELTCFAMSFNWIKMIATVNVGSEKSRARMAHWIAKWEAERKKQNRDTIVPYSNPDYWG